MSAYKIVGRTTIDSMWERKLKVGLQAKKRVYTSEADFKRYAPKTAMRWRKFCKYDVKAYEMAGDEFWIEIEVPKGDVGNE